MVRSHWSNVGWFFSARNVALHQTETKWTHRIFARGDKNPIDLPSGGRKREVNPLPLMMWSIFFFTRWTLASFECTGATITRTCVISAVFAAVKRCAEWTLCRTVGWCAQRIGRRCEASLQDDSGWAWLRRSSSLGGLVVLAVMSRAEPGCQTSVCCDQISGLLVCAVSSPSPDWTSADPSVKPSAYSAVPTTEQPARWSLPASSNGCWLGLKHKCGTFSVPADPGDFFFSVGACNARGDSAPISQWTPADPSCFSLLNDAEGAGLRRDLAALVRWKPRESDARSRPVTWKPREPRDPSDRCEHEHAPWMIPGSSGGGGCRWDLIFYTSQRNACLSLC